MKRLALLSLFYGLTLFLYAQNPEISKNDKDSIDRMMRRRMENFEDQMRIYKYMMESDPKAAMDSIVAIKKNENRKTGARNLVMLLNHDRVDTLKMIDLSYAGLTEIPEKVYKAVDLEVLVLDYNNIKKLPKELAGLKKLRRIYWKGNNLEDFWWISIKNIDQIEKLDLSYNTLSRLPIGIRKLDSLKELVIDENLFQEIPVRRLSKAKSVRSVSMNKSPQLVISENTYHKLNFIKTLKINNCDIKAFHPSIYQMSGLEELQIQENKITEIPYGISAWKNLKKLSFYKNELTQLPPGLFTLDSLEVIDLYFNNLEVIPEELGNLRSLEILYLASNKIYSVPESIGQLTKLEYLYLHRNRLSVLPSSINKLSQLKVIRVNENYLIDFPRQILALEKLEDIDISDNEIKSIPKEFEQFEHLKLFTFLKNPIDFNSPQNAYLAPMIYRLIESGVVCIPRIEKEEVTDPVDGSN